MAAHRTVYIGAFAHSATLAELEIVPYGIIGVDEQGTIAFIYRPVDAPTQRAQLNDLRDASGEHWDLGKVKQIRTPTSYSSFFFPGFIDTHIHAPQFPNNGIFGSSTLLDWLETYTFPLESSFRNTARAEQVYSRVISRTLSHGTTTASYFATVHVEATNALARLCHERGQRALVGRVCMDRNVPSHYCDESPEAAHRASKESIDYIRTLDQRGVLLRPIVTPRFAISCTEASLALLGQLAKSENCPIQTHISENHDEIAFTRSLFPDHESYTSVYSATGLLTSQTILAHGVYLEPQERKQILAAGAGIAHCPASNTGLTSGRAPIRQFLDEGLKVGLGTDCSAGYTPSILAQAREAIFVSRHVAMDQPAGEKRERAKLGVKDALWLATKGGAKVVGLEGVVGGFEVGMQFDAQMVGLGRGCVLENDERVNGHAEHVDDHESTSAEAGDDGPVDVFGRETWEDKLAKWVYTGDDRNTLAVWVKGRCVHRKNGGVDI